MQIFTFGELGDEPRKRESTPSSNCSGEKRRACQGNRESNINSGKFHPRSGFIVRGNYSYYKLSTFVYGDLYMNYDVHVGVMSGDSRVTVGEMGRGFTVTGENSTED